MGDFYVCEDNVEFYCDFFGEIFWEVDVLVFVGDLMDFGKLKEVEFFVQDLKVCLIFVVGVFGNYDYECGVQEEVLQILCDVGMKLFDG